MPYDPDHPGNRTPSFGSDSRGAAMIRLLLLMSALLLCACDENHQQKKADWDTFGEVSERNGFLCSKVHPDWTENQCLEKYNKVRKAP
jgi:hypothetical protein